MTAQATTYDIDDVLLAYGDLLQEQSGLLRPESVLPAPMQKIKDMLLADAAAARRGGNHEQVNNLRTCYMLLSNFVPDDVAARVRGTMVGMTMNELNAAFSAASAADVPRLLELVPTGGLEELKASAAEGKRLTQEFDALLDHLLASIIS